jgi:hypothetical protein
MQTFSPFSHVFGRFWCSERWRGDPIWWPPLARQKLQMQRAARMMGEADLYTSSEVVQTKKALEFGPSEVRHLRCMVEIVGIELRRELSCFLRSENERGSAHLAIVCQSRRSLGQGEN